MLFIHGDSLQSHIVAIVNPEPLTVKDFCRKNNLDSSSMAVMIQHSEVKKLIKDDMQRLAHENKLNSLEQVRSHFRFVEQPFEVGTILTPTLKLRRAPARLAFKNLIREMYEDSD